MHAWNTSWLADLVPRGPQRLLQRPRWKQLPAFKKLDEEQAEKEKEKELQEDEEFVLAAAKLEAKEEKKKAKALARFAQKQAARTACYSFEENRALDLSSGLPTAFFGRCTAQVAELVAGQLQEAACLRALEA